ncbi:hypothetical protein V6N11_031477 [Hibiscus sabdariffa]|uniref:RNase H type-1 domain-containing protein n=1 Tax=Hibiscus sabdariffa TaxID=183260 RepID=A0ABR2SYJ1_9ROSI
MRALLWCQAVKDLKDIADPLCRIEVPPVEPASDQISTPKVSDNGLDQTSNLEVLNGGSDRAVILFNGLSEPSFNGLGNVVLDLEDPCSTEAVDVPSLLAPRRLKCVPSFGLKRLKISRILQIRCEQMIFGVFGAANFNGVGCDGALCVEGGHIRALFSGPVSNYGADFATLFAVKVALEVFLEAKWSEDVVLVMELESQVVLNWLDSPLTRPWKWWGYFEELDILMSRSDNIHFKLVPKGENIIRPAHQHIKSFKVHHFQGLVCSVLVFSGAMVSIWFL